MALLPYIMHEPAGDLSPLIVDSPHSGRIYPVDFEYSCPLPLLRQAEDAWVDELVLGALAAGAPVICAEFPRSMIDTNRSQNDIDPAAIEGEWPHTLAPDKMTKAGFGLVRRVCGNGIDLYRGKLTAAEIQRRIDVYYRPYHDAVRQQVEKRVAHFGSSILIDAHSMPDRGSEGISRPDFILGDRDGTSCAPSFTRHVQRMLQDMGYRVTLNAPYKGREIVQRYGAQGQWGKQGAQALQIEMNRKLYMNEATLEKNSGFDGLQRDLTTFFHALAQYVTTENLHQLAAE